MLIFLTFVSKSWALFYPVPNFLLYPLHRSASDYDLINQKRKPLLQVKIQ